MRELEGRRERLFELLGQPLQQGSLVRVDDAVPSPETAAAAWETPSMSIE